MKRSGWIPLLLGCLVALLVEGLAQTEFLHKIELRTLDYRYGFRERYALDPVAVDPDIVLVLLNEETARRYPEPMALWLPYYADLVAGLGHAGVTAIGIDDLLSYVDQQQVGPFGLTIMPYRDRLGLIGYLGENDEHARELFLPHPILQALVGADNLVLANLSRDLDGVCRAQQIVPWAFAVPGKKDAWDCLSGWLAHKHTGQEPHVPVLGPQDQRMLINYAGSAPNLFKSFPFHEVVEHIRAQDHGWLERNFKGKVVLVGRGSASFQDIVETPFSALVPQSMLGIVVQANILNTLLTGQTLQRASLGENAAVLVLVCCLAALLAYRLPLVPGALACGVLVLLLPVGSLFLFSHARLWLDLAAPELALPLVWGLVYSYRYRLELRQRRLVQATFGRYLSSDLVAQLLADPEKRKIGAGQRQEVTVLFCDINGFTSASEKLDPQDVVRMLNAYLGEMTAIIGAHGGNVEKYIGDAIVASFGAMRPDPEAESAAVRSAVAMIRRLRELEKIGGGGFYRTKVGIHSGPVTVGNIGSRERMEYTLIGDTVNLTARIMDMTKKVGGEILISAAVYAKVKDLPGVKFVDKQEQEIRGRLGKVALYEVEV